MEQQLIERRDLFDSFIIRYMSELDLPKSSALARLKASLNYSLLSGGKRFRPVLALAFCEAFAVSPSRVLPWAAAVEMIHTYSLIHDDLPCMDNDDLRRGQPTNHKVFGEAQALLAGDALLTEAFSVVAAKYQNEPMLVVSLVQKLAEAAGICGMVGGQAIDMVTQDSKQTDKLELELIHKMKTGALIRVSVEGAAITCGLPKEKIQKARLFGESIGLAFQVADDLLDFDPGQPEPGNFATVIGVEPARQLLADVSQQALGALKELGLNKENSDLLHYMVAYNGSRVI